MERFISVVIPTYNRCAYLERAIASVLKQSFKNFIIIVSDNASTDGTQAFMKDIIQQHDNIIYQRNEKNIGMTLNFQKGFNLVNTDYYMILDDDNYLEYEHYFYDAYNLIHTKQNVILVHGGFCRHTHTKRELVIKDFSLIEESKMYFEHYWDKGINCMFPIIQVEAAKKCYPYKYESTMLDNEVILKVLLSNSYVGYIPKIVGIWWLHDGSETNKFLFNREKIKSYFTSIDRVVKYYSEGMQQQLIKVNIELWQKEFKLRIIKGFLKDAVRIKSMIGVKVLLEELHKLYPNYFEAYIRLCIDAGRSIFRRMYLLFTLRRSNNEH